jgi:HEAT repeat protein
MARNTANAEALVRLLPYAEWYAEGGREVLHELEALGPAAVFSLARTLADPSRGRFPRLAAAWVLGRIGTREAQGALHAATEDDDREVASTAAKVLTTRTHMPSAVA